jgi:SAM-dependent methyltransferase
MRRTLRNIRVRIRRGLGLDNHATVFDRIYRDNVWLMGSGPGSTPEDTLPYRAFLQGFLAEHQIRSVVDLGCGDWQFSKMLDWTGIEYIGVDVSAIALEKARIAAGGQHRFLNLNAVSDALPKADLLITKDVLQHLSNQDVTAILGRLPGFKYALLTNGFQPSQARRINTNISFGEYSRPVDLSAPPFNLPGKVVFAYTGHEPKETFLWTASAGR